MPDDKKPQKPQNDGIPKFGLLLSILLLSVIFVGVLTWVMQTYFPNFGFG